MKIRVSSLIVNICILVTGSGIAEDPCSDKVYKYLPRAEYRGGNCEYNDQKETCDAAILSGWYRATGANGNLRMQETAAEPFKCGTKFPIWMHGTHPTASDGEVEMTLQQALTNRTMSTTVKNCNDEYFVYKLQPTNACPEAYCFGVTDTDSCPPFDPCDMYEHQKVEYEAGRSSECSMLTGGSCVRESYNSQWVVFKGYSGGFLNVSSKASGFGSCGSRAPMWIKETLSTAPDGIRTEKVCVESKTDECATGVTMRSKSCDAFTVYEPPLDVACSRLCLDDPEPSCPEETTTPNRTSNERSQVLDISYSNKNKHYLWSIVVVIAVAIMIIAMIFLRYIRNKVPTNEKKTIKEYANYADSTPEPTEQTTSNV